MSSVQSSAMNLLRHLSVIALGVIACFVRVHTVCTDDWCVFVLEAQAAKVLFVIAAVLLFIVIPPPIKGGEK